MPLGSPGASDFWLPRTAVISSFQVLVALCKIFYDIINTLQYVYYIYTRFCLFKHVNIHHLENAYIFFSFLNLYCIFYIIFQYRLKCLSKMSVTILA